MKLVYAPSPHSNKYNAGLSQRIECLTFSGILGFQCSFAVSFLREHPGAVLCERKNRFWDSVTLYFIDVETLENK